MNVRKFYNLPNSYATFLETNSAFGPLSYFTLAKGTQKVEKLFLLLLSFRVLLKAKGISLAFHICLT